MSGVAPYHGRVDVDGLELRHGDDLTGDQRAWPAPAGADLSLHVGAAIRRPLLRVLLVEDDDGDSILVGVLLEEAFGADAIEVVRARSVAEACRHIAAREAGSRWCSLVDLGLPDAQGLDVVSAIRDAAPFEPLVVLTGLVDDGRGLHAVAAGAQDYLVKGKVDPEGLRRAINYAIERCRADESARLLLQERLQHQENARLERGLLPLPLLERHAGVRWMARYRPGSDGMRIGGDFYDLVERNGMLHLLIGDVCGHGPDEAALGVRMRVAWRTLVRAGLDPVAVVEQLNDLMASEAVLPGQFTTLASVRVLDSTHVGVVLAGHPPLLILDDQGTRAIDVSPAPPLGIRTGALWTETIVELADPTGLLAYTDGLIEGRATPENRERLGIDEVTSIIEALRAEGRAGADMLDRLMAEVERRNGGPIDDDIAILSIELDSLDDVASASGGEPA